MKKIWTYILTKAKQRFRAYDIELDAAEMSFRPFKGLKIKNVTASTSHYPVSFRMDNVRFRFNLLRVLAGKNKLPDRLAFSFTDLIIRGPGHEWRLHIKNVTGHLRRSGKSTRLMATIPALELFHEQLIPIPLPLSVSAVDLTLQRTGNGLIMEQTIQCSFPTLNFTIQSRFRTGAGAIFTCSLQTSDFVPDDIMRSFPVFTDSDAQDYHSSGSLRFSAGFTADPSHFRRHSFQAKLFRKDFSFAGKGAFNLGYLKGPFLHVIRGQGPGVAQASSDRGDQVGEEEWSNQGRHGCPRTAIFLGKENPHFAALDTISETLINVIISREDPRFYTHHGFDEQLFGYALVIDFREKKAARGGSTITMQLARNLFLHHGRSVYRKLEEAILTWLIEDIYHIPKERILEIYLNIIEFGPDIYGIREACLFYFATTPDRVTLTQSLVLSYIIPRPRHFAAALKEKSPVLPARLGQHVHRTARALRKKGIIGEEEFRSIGAGISFAESLGEIQFVR